jgi:hypothetical protein
MKVCGRNHACTILNQQIPFGTSIPSEAVRLNSLWQRTKPYNRSHYRGCGVYPWIHRLRQVNVCKRPTNGFDQAILNLLVGQATMSLVTNSMDLHSPDELPFLMQFFLMLSKSKHL